MRKKKEITPSSSQNNIMYAVDNDARIADHIREVKNYATADDAVLSWLVGCYEEAVKDKRLDGPKHAVEIFWKKVSEVAPDTLKAVLNRARLPYIEHALDNIRPLDFDQLQAVQELVKMNPAILRLPFIQDTFINLLRTHTYTSEGGGDELRNIWKGFLHTRPCGKVKHAPDAIADLVTMAVEKGETRVSAYDTVASGLGVGERFVREIAGEKGKRGRPKSGK
ncbi:MAG TPA: hypothetical protein DDW94_11240 [Deltaproteobacteria bacterium]|nr:MAG: hypothetical protein A2Z79_04800 [Deltaproteobacteria bacterium GWA2_55_82]OGQ63894.1 MAG: hypothetical protein A3I81_12860 [Deltaproteobacteria bacterium RIFCSPLOWO2_02_FULL_55_12]OIJ72643.1 MAG: hypothetical protein A2V21_312370 [Deltaproteobacteria bacterium GWC2_55_46]HBG47545.1 hypothetical protein [Deltaproteobacteria bacterium]HCY10456.1 hypothetical protein [Deltaproteobacteria bacterium]